MSTPKQMTARERLFAVINRQPVDHTPIWLLFPYHSAGYYADVRTLPCYQPIFEASKKYAIMLNRRNPKVSTFTSDVKIWSDNQEANGEKISRTTLEYKGRQLYSEIRKQPDGTQVKKLINSDADLEFICSLPINNDPAAIENELKSYLPEYRREVDEFPTEYGAMMLDMGEPINYLYGNSNLEEYAIWSLSHNDLVVDFCNRLMEQKRLMYEYTLKQNMADIYFMVGSELASPPLVSRKTFQKWVVPYATELIEQIHASGKKVIQHYHGQIKQILPDFIGMAPDALHTIEAPPIGNCTFTQAYEIVGDSMVLIGNIQYDDFRAFTPQQMQQAVIAVLEECKGKRLILSPSAGPYEEYISPRMVENYLSFLETGWNYPVRSNL